jgi:hypothetical protein
MASRRLHLAPSEALVSRGSRRAAGEAGMRCPRTAQRRTLGALDSSICKNGVHRVRTSQQRRPVCNLVTSLCRPPPAPRPCLISVSRLRTLVLLFGTRAAGVRPPPARRYSPKHDSERPPTRSVGHTICRFIRLRVTSLRPGTRRSPYWVVQGRPLRAEGRRHLTTRSSRRGPVRWQVQGRSHERHAGRSSLPPRLRSSRRPARRWEVGSVGAAPA